MKVIFQNYKSCKKYIIYDIINDKPILHFTYKIFYKRKETELTIYKDGKINIIENLPVILEFNQKEPIQSINKFHKMSLIGIAR